MEIEGLIADPPHVHGGGTLVWALAPEVLRFIDGRIDESSRTVETGLGVSTALFAARGARHVCITPVGDEIEELRAYCRAKRIGLETVEFLQDYSENVVPTLGVAELDLVLIDGGHGFPTPFLDWCYLSQRLKVGGIVIVDDTQIWTGSVLKNFLMSESNWILERTWERAVAFRLLKPVSPAEWGTQPFVRSRSKHLIAYYRVSRAWGLIVRGDIRGLVRGIGKELERR